MMKMLWNLMIIIVYLWNILKKKKKPDPTENLKGKFYGVQIRSKQSYYFKIICVKVPSI